MNAIANDPIANDPIANDPRTSEILATMKLQTEMLENMQVGLCILKYVSLADPYSLVLTFANPAASKFTGVPLDSYIGQRWLDIFPALTDELIDTYAGVVREQLSVDLGVVEYGDARVEQGFFTLKAFPLADNLVGLAFENITERKRDETIRLEQAAKLKVLFDYAAVGMARLSVDGHWTQVNQKLCDLFGYTKTELLEKTFAEVTHSDDAETDNTIYQQLLSGKTEQVNFEKRYITKEGKVVWADVTVSNVYDAQGALSCFIATIQDITKEKEATLNLKQQKNDLIAVNLMLTNTMGALEQRNQELDQFAYVTSHDLKAPLRAIANLTTWIEEDLGSSLPAENAEQFELLKNRVHRMEGLINGLLEYSRIGRTHQSHERVDIAELLQEVMDLVDPPKHFTLERSQFLPVLEAKKVPLIQIFSNLISNAIKHHHQPSAGIVVNISARELPDFYEFTVSDNGPGIDADYHDRIFTIFQTLKARDELETTGIGLSIAKKAVNAEGGEITVASAPGEGATFTFTWPKSPLLHPY